MKTKHHAASFFWKKGGESQLFDAYKFKFSSYLDEAGYVEAGKRSLLGQLHYDAVAGCQGGTKLPGLQKRTDR